MSRISSGIPIFAMSSQEKTLGKVTLYRSVFSIYFKIEANQDHVEINRNIECRIIYPKTDFLG